MQNILTQIFSEVGSYIPELLGAMVILIVGWLIALILSNLARSVLKRTELDNKIVGWVTGEKAPNVEEGTGRIIFWLIMIFVLIAFFQALGLTLVTDPLNQLMNQILLYIPQLFGAGILLLIAWIVATVLRMIITKVMGAAKVDERVGGQVKDRQAVPLTKTIGDVVYWLIFLLFLPAVLGALNLQGLLDPVQSMLDKFLGFIPNLLAAALIGLIGWFVARIVRQIVTSLLAAAGGDRLSDRIGIAPLSNIVGLTVYILIIIPVIIAALNALALDAITKPASNMLNLILGAIPAIFAAAVVLTIAYMVGKVLTGLIADFLTGMGFNTILKRLGIGGEPKEGERTPSQIVGYLVLVTIMLFAIFEAASLLGFEALADVMKELTVLGGHIILGLIIFALGLYLANLASKTIQASKADQADLLSKVARIAIIVLAGSIALRYTGLANEIINLAFGLILGALALALAISFGIGGREIAARKLEEWVKTKGSE
ncbi:MAG: mechanosensitive ion channel [Thermodesulfobacteriota bacterium]|nr:mechanosensitive ion channel [Thermodesulfobacteriota bacterium]